MPSRSEMDRPAMLAVTVVGLLLIAASVILYNTVLDEEGADYVIAWSEAEVGSAQAVTGTAGATTTIRVPVTDALPSNATIEVGPCTDAGAAPLSQPATISWTLFEGDEEKDSGTASCASDGPFVIQLDAHPDFASTSAASQGEAEEQAYAAGHKETVEFRLEFSWNRPAAPAPLPLPNPAFTATVTLTIEEWIATANEAGQEAPR